MPATISACPAIARPSTVMMADDVSGKPPRHHPSLSLKPRHQPARVDHQQPDGDEHRREPHAEGRNQEQTEADAPKRHRAQQDHQRRRARDDAARDSECEELPEPDRLAGGKVMVVPMVMAVIMGVIVAVVMAVIMDVLVPMVMAVIIDVLVAVVLIATGITPQEEGEAEGGDDEADSAPSQGYRRSGTIYRDA